MNLFKADARENAWQKLMQLANSYSPEIAAGVLKAIDVLKTQYTASQILKALESGQVDELLDAMVANPLFTQALQQPLRAAILTVAESETENVKPTLVVAFDHFNPRAVEIVQNEGARLVQEVSDGMRETVRAAVSDGIRTGSGTAKIASNIRQYIGLTKTQVTALNNFRRMLEEQNPEALERELRDQRFDRTVQRMLDGKITLTKDQIDKMVEASYQKRLTYRATTIARTESINALSSGQRAAWRVIFDQAGDKVDQSQTRRFWYVAHDERTCPECSAVPRMNPDGVGIDEPFKTPEGDVMGPCLHVDCRCTVFVKPLFV